MTTLVNGTALGGADLANFSIGAIAGGTILDSTATLYRLETADGGSVQRHIFTGVGLTYDGLGRLAGGAELTAYQITNAAGDMIFDFSGFHLPIAAVLDWAARSDNDTALRSLLLGEDTITGTALADQLKGFAGGDSISGGAGGDTIDGGAGTNYLRGDDGDDSINGGSGFSDINGNQGNDTISGGAGGEWVVGGKDNDFLFGEGGNDIVLGNLGADWCDGGDGNDTVRGGQENDIILGAGGDDWLSGDRGDDTLTGGFGADIFHSFGDAGVDRVTDFSRAQGDRVLLDAGTTYTATQLADDTVIDMTGGGRMILVGVTLASLTGDWITVG